MTELNGGEVFAGYVIDRRLGAGGYGSVYLAKDPQLPRRVALKLLDHSMTEDSRRRFTREGDLTAGLDHPNIVTVYNRGVQNGTMWIAMQYVPGTDAAMLADLAPERGLRIGAEIAAALDHAHGAGILHRDVKPANILLATPEPGHLERVLLTDFGIARLRAETTRLTRTGVVTGTAAFISPEQVSGGPVDHRSDQYSLACTLFQLLTGQPPYSGSDMFALLLAHVQQSPRQFAEIRPDLTALDTVFARALSKRSADRFDTCAEFVSAARDALTDTSVATIGLAATADSPGPVSVRAAKDTASRPLGRRTVSRPVAALSEAGRHHGRVAAAVTTATALIAAIGIWLHSRTGADRSASLAEPTTRSPSVADSWGRQYQAIAKTFPALVGTPGDSNGWSGANCNPGPPPIGENAAYQDTARIVCNSPGKDGKPVYDIFDRAGTDEADLPREVYARSLLSACPPPRSRPAPHPGTSGDPWAFTCHGTDFAADRDSFDATHRVLAWILFPDNSDNSQFLMAVRWPDHTLDDLLDNWWAATAFGT